MVLRVLSHTSSVQCLIRLEMRKWTTNRVEEVLVSNSSLVSGHPEASGVEFSWGEVSQESPKNQGNREIKSLLSPY